MQDQAPDNTLKSLHASHPRDWRGNLYVYPVISRRSRGLSVGINLNPDKTCNFDCVYCQVDRDLPCRASEVDLDVLRAELRTVIEEAVSARLFESLPFSRVPGSGREVKDIALSGDGEPTLSRRFLQAVRIAADTRREFGLRDARIVLITNAACLHRPEVREALTIMDANNGEIWAKLDAGTEEYYRRINRAGTPLDRILTNILEVSRVRPIVIQSLWMNLDGQLPPPGEVEAYAERVRSLVQSGGQIRLIQVYTVARQTAEAWVEPLREKDLDAVASRISTVSGVPTAIFPA
jgi:wyosine [tRNA(Phe)-imidazoG37] synthetase (radical SAM superfamily)